MAMTASSHGTSSHGHTVHLSTMAHLPSRTSVDRFNTRFGIGITNRVGTMWCAYLFCLLALVSLPSTLVNTGWVSASVFPGWLVGTGLVGLISWIAQTFLQLVLLSVIIVGQNAQSAASDARQALMFDHTETIMDRVNEHTDGGIKATLDAITALRQDILGSKTSAKAGKPS